MTRFKVGDSVLLKVVFFIICPVVISLGLVVGALATGVNVLPPGVDNSKAAIAIGDYGLYLLGGCAIFGFSLAVFQIVEGLVYGRLAKNINMLAERTTGIRFGTAVGFYDGVVTKLGPYAVYTEYVDSDGVIVRDRQPYKAICTGRLTTVTVRGKT